MAIEIKEVSSRRDLKSFIYFPFWLYNGNTYWVPPLIKVEKFSFDKNRNPFYNFGDTRLYLVYKDRRIAGRVAVLAKHAELESEQKMRFGWLDFEDDREVSSLLFEAIEESARELNATKIEGPVGFNDGDHQGILIEGFQEKATLGSAYNSSYYQRHIESWDFAKKYDLVDYKLLLQATVTDETATQTAIENLALTESQGAKKELSDYFVRFASAYKPLLPFIPQENILALKDGKSQIVALSAIVPSFEKTMQQTKGHLTLLASLLLMLNKKGTKEATLLLRFDTESPQKELAQFLISKATLFCKAKNISTLTSNPVLESSELESIWQSAGATPSKRRRVYSKSLSN